MSGIRIPDRHFGGRTMATEMDDNTGLLLDFGNALFVFAYAAAAGAINPQFGATTFHGTGGTLDGILLNGEPIDVPGREDTLAAPVWDWEVQCRTLPHVTGPHRAIPESHVFEGVMQLVRWVRDGIPSRATAEQARHVVEIIEAGYRAAETGQTQTLHTTFNPE
jgi:predicted dehydrogenase